MKLDTLVQLLGDAFFRLAIGRVERMVVTKCASSVVAVVSVAVGTAETCIDGEFLHSVAVDTPEKISVSVIAMRPHLTVLLGVACQNVGQMPADNRRTHFVDIGLQMQQTTHLGRDDIFGTRCNSVVDLAFGQTVGNGGEIVGKLAAVTAADITLLHLHQFQVGNGTEQLAGFVIKPFAVRVGGTDIVTQSGAMVHESHLVGKTDILRLIVCHMDQKVAEVVSFVKKLAIVVVERRVVEQTSEMHFHIGHTSASASHDMAAFVVIFNHLFTKHLGAFAIALVIEVLATAGKFLGVEALHPETLKQTDHGKSCPGGELVDTARNENSNSRLICEHVIPFLNSKNLCKNTEVLWIIKIYFHIHQKICIFASTKAHNPFMTEQIILLALAVFPVIVLATYIYRKDRFEKEPVRMLIKAFLFGCLSVVPAIFLESFLSSLYTGFGGDSLPGFVYGLYNGYVVAGSSEELCKLLLLMWAVWRSRDFNEYFDGIVYATFVSLGFASLENILYVFSQDNFSSALMTGSMRAVLSVPGHFLFGVAMGYYVALAKFQPEKRGTHLLMAFFFPMLLHGTFDALLMIPEAMGNDSSWLSAILFPVFIYFDIRMWKICMRKLRHLQELSEKQSYQSDAYESDFNSGNDPEPPFQGNSSRDDGFSNFNWDV